MLRGEQLCVCDDRLHLLPRFGNGLMRAQQCAIGSAFLDCISEAFVDADLLLLMRPKGNLHQGVCEMSIAPV